VAQSRNVSYADPVVLHESSQSRIIFVPFFIQHTTHTELAGKIVTYRKSPPPEDWIIREEKSVSLSEEVARQLLEALRQHLAVSIQNQNGAYIAIRVSDGVADVGALDPSVVAQAVAGLLNQRDIVRHLASKELSAELVAALRGAIRLQELRSAAAILRQHLDAGVTDEGPYQAWCENHSWAFGNAYVLRDETREISPGDHVDLLLPSVIVGYRDIVELKRPDMEVLFLDAPRRSFYFSKEVSKAVGQCHRYLDVLQEEANKGLRDHPEIVAYHPRATIVIGRSKGWPDDKLRALHGLNSRLNGIIVMTYDQLLAQAERLLDIVTTQAAKQETLDPSAGEEPLQTFDHDDMPF